MSLHGNLRLSAIKGGSQVKAENALNAIKTAKLPTPNLETIFKNIDAKWDVSTKQLKTSTGIPMSDVNRMIRRGELKELVSSLHINIQITPTLETAFKKLNSICPEFHLREQEAIYVKSRNKYPTLDIKPSPDIKTKLSKSDTKRLNNVGKKLKTMLGVGGVAVGVFFAVKLGSDFIESLNQAAKEASGCYLTWVVNGEVQSAKMCSRSLNKETSKPTIPDQYDYNAMAYLQWAIKHNKNLKQEFGVDYDVTTIESVKKALSTNKTKFIEYWQSNSNELSKTMRNDLNLFDTTLFPEKDICRACIETASLDQILFALSPSDNMHWICKEQPSLLEVLIDVTKKAGIDIFKFLGGSFFNNPIVIGIFIFIVVILILAFVKRK